MDKETALKALLQRCFDARLAVYELCDLAKVSRATPSRWKKRPEAISPGTLARLENALDAYERSKAA